MYKLYQYNNDVFRILVTKDGKHFQKREANFHSDSASLQSSLSRSKRMIREYSLCNDFVYFFTSTVNSKLCDRFSLSETQDKIRKIMKSIKRKYPNFIYLFITEKHKDGAFHFHGLCSDLPLYTNNNGYFSSSDFDKLGFNSFSLIKDKNKISNYITKYITKDCVKNEAGSIYFCSRGLKKASSYEVAPLDLAHHIFSVKPYENDFLLLYDFNINSLSKDEVLYLFNNLQEKDVFLKNLSKNS